MAHAATLYATDGGAGLKDGSSLANAAAIDPSDANDIWTIVMGDLPASGDTQIWLCADAAVTVNSTIAVTRDGIEGQRFVVRGRNAAGTADAEVTLNANGGAYSVVTMTTGDHWTWYDIDAYNTNQASGNNAWTIGANADHCIWIRCSARDAYYGFSNAGANNQWYDSRALDNASDGWQGATAVRCHFCTSQGNGGSGYDVPGTLVQCMAISNTSDGYANAVWCLYCTAYGNGSHNYVASTNSNPVFMFCVSEAPGAYDYYCTSSGQATLYKCASAPGGSGRLGGTTSNMSDIDPIINSSGTFFVAAGSGDFTPNNTAGQGALIRGLEQAHLTGDCSTFNNAGAIQQQTLPWPGNELNARLN